jgi:hypothetical protein
VNSNLSRRIKADQRVSRSLNVTKVLKPYHLLLKSESTHVLHNGSITRTAFSSMERFEFANEIAVTAPGGHGAKQLPPA